MENHRENLRKILVELLGYWDENIINQPIDFTYQLRTIFHELNKYGFGTDLNSNMMLFKDAFYSYAYLQTFDRKDVNALDKTRLSFNKKINEIYLISGYESTPVTFSEDE